MNADVRPAELLAIGRPHLVLANEAAGAAVPVDERRHLGRVRGEARAESELLEEAGRVGRQRHGGAHFTKFGRLLVDLGVETVPAERDRQGQPADAGADDGDATPVRGAHGVRRRARQNVKR